MSDQMDSETARDSIAYHAQLADGWETRYLKKSFAARLHVLRECLEGRDLRSELWVDTGCGTGTLSRWLAEQGCHVYGVDAAPEMVKIAASMALRKSYPGTLRFERIESIANLPIPSASLDGVLCSSVLEYVQDPDACLHEFVRVLRPGGLLLVSVPNAQSVARTGQVAIHRLGRFVGMSWFRFLYYSKHQYSKEQFIRFLAAHRFRAKKVLPFGSPIPVWLQRRRLGGSLLMFLAAREQ
jgi:2-polyprenyl-6-hydroxyphenyl methylase/3-demethylubiquinone-9 3-methyltransferase